MSIRAALLGIAAAAGGGWIAAGAVAQAPAELAEALRRGIVGERYDGYMGFTGTPSQTVRSQVGAVNIRRRSLYIRLAQRRNVIAQVVGIATGCQLLARVQPGQVYMLEDGQWRRRGPAEPPPSPPHCKAS